MIIITGARKGLGKAIYNRLKKKGNKVLGISINKSLKYYSKLLVYSYLSSISIEKHNTLV